LLATLVTEKERKLRIYSPRTSVKARLRLLGTFVTNKTLHAAIIADLERYDQKEVRNKIMQKR